MIIKEIPAFERPREKAINQGVHYLSNTELLAILLRTGTKNENVLRVSEKLVYKLSNIEDLMIGDWVIIKDYPMAPRSRKITKEYLMNFMMN